MARIDPHLSFEMVLPSIIAERPSQVHRYREVHTDTFRGSTTYPAGPYTVRIEPLRTTMALDTYDEKGSVTTLLFQLVGIDLPVNIEHGGVLQPLFQLNDKITDQDGNAYRISAPPWRRNRTTVLTLELRSS